jgi:hypothetical protein
MRNATVPVGIVTIFGFLFGGCAMGPKYDYVRQHDFVAIRCGDIDPTPGSSPDLFGDSQISVNSVDGTRIGYFDDQQELFCAPGQHRISLVFGHSARGRYSGEGSGSANGTVVVLLEGRHIYRFTALFGFNTFSVTLWDETRGMADRSIVTEWSIDKKRVEIITPNH